MVARGQPVIVTGRNVVCFIVGAVGCGDDGPPLGNGNGRAAGIGPGSIEIRARGQFVAQVDVDAVAAVIFVGEPAAEIDAAVGEAAFALGQRVGQPAGQVAGGLLGEEFQTPGAALADFHAILPVAG